VLLDTTPIATRYIDITVHYFSKIIISGHYLEVEVAGTGFTTDVIEFLVKRNVVAYRSMANKVTYVYPFTTALGDSKGQTGDELGWFAPDTESMDS
jgi:hypothetical protein